MRFLTPLFLAFALLFTAQPAAAQGRGDADWLYRGSDIPRDAAWVFGSLPNGVRYAVRRNALPAGQVSIRVRIGAGALNEEDAENGWAHLIEHLAFRGSASFGDREARHIWQQLGASFGSDTNASTDSTQTVYQLDLPKNDRASLDQSLHIMAEMVDSALFDPAAVDAERKIVLAEKGRRPELSVRMQDVIKPLFYAGLKYAVRDTIGTDATLAAATPAGLRAFYERWYRPDNATVIVVGDADPAMMEELVRARFGDWQASGPKPADPDYGSIANPKESVAVLDYAGAPYAATMTWLQPWARRLHTTEREKMDLAQSFAVRIINRRLEAKARTGAAYVGAGIGAVRNVNVADITQLSVTAREGRWREALAEAYAIVADAVKDPPSQAEIDREFVNLRNNATAAVEGETTVKSNQRAQQVVNAVDGGGVVASAATSLALLDAFKPEMSPALIETEMKHLFAGAGPRLALLSPAPVEGGVPAVMAALGEARAAAPAVRQADRQVSFDTLPALGNAGREVSRERVADLDATIVRFANGSSLVFKQTDFEKGSVRVQLRFGSGQAGMRPDAPSMAWASGIVAPSGLADLDLDGVERLLTGRRMNLTFGIDEDAYVLSGMTNGTDLGDQLRLLATKLAYPRWDAPLFDRYKVAFLESYDLAYSSATSRASREAGLVTHRGDLRWGPGEKDEIARTTAADFQKVYAPRLTEGPIEAIIVGDVDLETAVQAMAKTIAALPPRPVPAPPVATASVLPPVSGTPPATFDHRGDRNQAYALVGWTTFGGVGRSKERRALALAASMLEVRLFDELREAEGASYSPDGSVNFARAFENWGVFYASSELRPESVDAFYRIARAQVADLATKPAAADEFSRAQNPVLSGIDRQLKTNAYWLGAMEGWSRNKALIDPVRTLRADYAALTPEAVRDAVARNVAEEGDWSMLVLPAKTTGGGH